MWWDVFPRGDACVLMLCLRGRLATLACPLPFPSPNTANSACVFATVHHLDGKLFAVLVGEAPKLELQVIEFNDRGPDGH